MYMYMYIYMHMYMHTLYVCLHMYNKDKHIQGNDKHQIWDSSYLRKGRERNVTAEGYSSGCT